MFAIVDYKSNRLLDFGVTTEVGYPEIFAYESVETDKAKDLLLETYLSPSKIVEESQYEQNQKSKDLEIFTETYILSYGYWKQNMAQIL